jgi:hypothetical protein
MYTLHERYIRAHQERKEKWFKEHPGKQHFELTLEEVRRDMQLDEWIYYLACRLCRTPEQRYQDEKYPEHGWNHKSDVHSIDGKGVQTMLSFLA